MNTKNIVLSLFLLLFVNMGQAQDVKINEIMYNFGFNLNSLESGNWVELYNTTGSPIVMDGWEVVFGTDTFAVGSYTLPAFSYINVVSKDTVFFENFPGVPYLGPTGFGLDNGGNDPVRVFDNTGALIDEVIYDNNLPWDVGADGQGRSLSLISPTLNNDLAASWSSSGLMGGTPGAANVNPCLGLIPDIVINEINYKSSLISPSGDWVELYNPGSSMVNLGGWKFLDSDIAFTIPMGTTIAPGGFIVIASDLPAFSSIFPSVSNVIPVSSQIGLSGNGEQTALINSSRCLIDHVKYNDSAPWPLAPDGTGPTLTLVDASNNNDVAGNWVDSNMATGDVFGTPGADNGVPNPCLAVPVNAYISELNYDSDSTYNGGDWIEIHNPNTFTIGISNYTLSSTGDGFKLPLGTIIMAGGYLVVAEDIADFSALYPTVTNVVPVGSDIKLSNGGDLVSLYNNLGCLIDSVHYDDKAPWPSGSAGTGYTIEHFATTAQTNDLGTNWLTSADFLGTPGAANNAQPCAAPASAPSVFNVSDFLGFASWDAVSSAVSYEVDYKPLTSSTWTTATVAAPTTFIALQSLTACTDYEVRVRTICAAGPSSYTTSVAFSTTGCFVCTAAQGTFSFNITNISAILTWDVLVSADSYTVYYKKSTDPTFLSTTTTFPISIVFGVSACTTYEWYVVNDCNGIMSGPSNVETFTTVCKGDIEAIDAAEDWTVYPIPASDQLFISSPPEAEIEAMQILDMKGKVLEFYEPMNESLEVIDISNFRNGMYILQLQTTEGISNKKFSIQR